MRRTIFYLLPIGAVLGVGAIVLAEPAKVVKENGKVIVTGVSLPGQSAAAVEKGAGATQTERVVQAAEAFLKTLDEQQQAQVLLPLSRENAARWSNFPSPFGQRNGIKFATLNEQQLVAALTVVKTATGSGDDQGFDRAMQIRMADDVYAIAPRDRNGGPGGMGPGPGGPGPGAPGPGGPGGPGGGGPGGSGRGPGGGRGGPGGVEFSSAAYYLAFLGKPSTTEPWLLQFGGHHLAFNVAFKGGAVVGATPLHTGVEPSSWISRGADGKDVVYSPLGRAHDAMAALLASLTEPQLAAAKLSKSFRDIVVGPGRDGQFPKQKEGLAVRDLSDAQKTLVLAAIKAWVLDADDATSAVLLKVYEQELNETFIAFAGGPKLDDANDYARIDGPSVWIEIACQGSSVTRVHYHTVWRDHQRDYGALFNFE